MKRWRLDLDQDEAYWLSKIMQSVLETMQESKKPFLPNSGSDTLNCLDIIRQIGEVDEPKSQSDARVTRIIDTRKLPGSEPEPEPDPKSA
jgi:hypothetical protein